MAIKEKGKFVVHKCSMCNYPCGFVVVQDNLYYDAGCGCVKDSPQLCLRSTSDLNYFTEHPAWKDKAEFFALGKDYLS